MSTIGRESDWNPTGTASTTNDENGRERKRRRGAHACDICRSRKVRCDGEQPCRNCTTAEIECTYGAEGLTKGKTDQILEGMQRVEASLNELRAMMNVSQTSAVVVGTPTLERRTNVTTMSSGQASEDRVSHQQRDKDEWTNAVLSAQHISSTESLLQWACFDAFPELRRNKQPVFQIEQQRLELSSRTDGLPRMSPQEIAEVLEEFRETVNFAYPILTTEEIDSILNCMLSSSLSRSATWCRALLVMALGCAGQVAKFAAKEETNIEDDISLLRRLAASYFALYLQQAYTLYNEISVVATQCLLFTALYFAYLQRPLQAWSYINLAATKCKCLLYYGATATAIETECLRRIFWSCYILESDYLAELAALPQSGVGDIESTVPLPADYHTSPLSSERDLSSLYFLACISMRRLLNRVHDLLYAPNTGVGSDDSRFPQIVRELDHQLEQWRAYLPHAFSFSIDSHPTNNQHGGFLRQRYLTCRSVIYRPFLTRALRDECEEFTLQQSEVCLDACILHIINLRPFKHTVLIDTWICSLSMASAMLVLLAAYQRPQLRSRLQTKIQGLGHHLIKLIESWIRLPGNDWSPSVEQSLQIIREIDKYVAQT